MKSRWFWFGLGIFAVLIFTVTFVCANSVIGNTPTTEARVPSASTQDEDSTNHLLPTASDAEAVSVSEETNPAASPNAQVAVDPPVPEQGGTCIAGFIIDRYHQARGSGWQVTVTSEDGSSLVAAANAEGHFDFPDLAGGNWTVALDLPEGWQEFTPTSFPVTLSGSGGNCAQVRFKVEALPCLDVTKLDANGQMGFKHKVGVPDWSMTATLGAETHTAATDGQGKCRFTDLTPGTWTIEEESKAGWIPAPGYANQQTIHLESPRMPGACESMVFVNQQIHGGCIQIRKVDPAGNPLKSWEVKIRRNDGTQPGQSAFTNSAGYATFTELALGQWMVEEMMKEWWRPVSATSYSVDLQEPGRCEPVVFTNEALGGIDGYKINHLEQGLAGWEIRAKNEDTGEELTATTDQNGYFQFRLPLGQWKVSEVMQTGWESVTPSEFEVEVTQPFKYVHTRFKNRTEFACLDVFKKDAVDGAGLPGWEISLQPAYGGNPTTKNTDGIGHVRFNALTPGTYVVSEKAQEDWVSVTAQSKRVTLEATGSCEVITFKNRQETTVYYKGSCPANYVTYIVRRGDTLYRIALNYGTTVAAIKRANGLWSNTIWVGQKLCIPDP